MSQKLGLVYNTAPHYRTAIFSEIDREFDCDWYFGPTKSDIREMDTSLLHNVHYYRIYGDPKRLYWQSGLLSMLFSRRYEALFMLSEVRSLSLWAVVLLKRIFRPKKKLYVWSHGCYGREGRLRQRLERWKNCTFDGIFLYNQYAKDVMSSYGVPADKIHVIANSLDYHTQVELREKMTPSDLFRTYFGNENKNLIFIGRLTRAKRLELVLHALTKLPGLNITLIGGGEDSDNLKRIANELGVIDRVWFYGPCYDEQENANLIYNADLCVSPGNIGLTAIHVMTFGTPAITHDSFPYQGPEFEAIRPGETGAFFKRGDVNSLVETIRGWFNGPGKNREAIRLRCYHEIDSKWNPEYQMEILRTYLKF